MTKTDPPKICPSGGQIGKHLQTLIRRKIKSEIYTLSQDFQTYSYIISEKLIKDTYLNLIKTNCSQDLQEINASITDSRKSEFYTKTKNILIKHISCGICLRRCETNQIVKPSSCQHVFCKDCLQQNFVMNKSRVCPVCKQKFFYMQPLHLNNGTLKTPVLLQFSKKKKYNTISIKNMWSRMQRFEKFSTELGKRKRKCRTPANGSKKEELTLKRGMSY